MFLLLKAFYLAPFISRVLNHFFWMAQPSGGGGSCLQRVNLYVSKEAAKTLEKKTCVMQKVSFEKRQ